MKRLLTAFLFILVAVTVALADAKQPSSLRQQCRGVRLTPEQRKTILAVQPWLEHKSKTQLPSSTSRQTSLCLPNTRVSVPAKANPSGSRIQGWRTSVETTMPNGWYELGINGSETLLWEYDDPNWVDDGWNEGPVFPFNSGFWRDGKVYGFHSEMRLYWLVWGHGSFTLDGEISDLVTYGEDYDLMDFSTYVLSCVYNPENDKVYAYTLNSDASAYMLQSVNPETWTFTPIKSNVALEDICIGFCYNATDKKIYGMTPDCRFVTFDSQTGDLTQLAKYKLSVTTALGGLTYSPIDNLFFFVYADGKAPSTLNTINPSDYSLEKRADLGVSTQYSILICPDKVMPPKSPMAPEIIALDFEAGKVNGKATLRLPDKTFDGSTLTGELKLLARVDGKTYSESYAQPGSTVDISFNDIADGNHKFSFSVFSGDLESAEADQTLFVGFDTPKVPQNIRLEAGSLVWNAVSEGINGGYIDTDALTYNVYLNGVKINDEPIDDCSYSFNMPEETFRKYVAQVNADNHGRISEKGFSNDIKYGNPFPLPFNIRPTEAESELVKMVSSDPESSRHWIVNADESQGTYFTCFTSSFGNNRDEWVYMPAVSIPQSDKLVEISFEIKCQGYEENYENLTVGFGNEQTPESFSAIKTYDSLTNDNWEKKTIWCHQEAGNSYLGFMTSLRESGYIIMLRNVSVKLSDRPSTTPRAVENLNASAMPKGELKAKINFTLPIYDVAGNKLADSSLNAKVETAAEVKIVTGAPGSDQTVEVSTEDGMNTVTVTADNAASGISSSVKVFTGLDVPMPLNDLKVSNSEDYKSLHLEWEAPTEGANGGYIDPAKVTYALCLFNEEKYEWEIIRQLGSVTYFDYTPKAYGKGLEIAECAILTQNEKGNNGKIRSISAPFGNPYSLPMIEAFGEKEYEPKIMAKPDDSYTAEWAFIQSAYPYWVSQPTPYGNDAYVCSGSNGEKARIILPAFSTEGVKSAGIEMPLWRGPESGEIRVYAQAYGIEPELLGTFHDVTEDGWTKRRFHLPSEFMGKKWVNIIIDGVFDGDSQTVGFGDFKIKTFVSDDMAVTNIGVPAFPIIGNSAEITAEIENFGLQTAEAPQMELTLSRGETNLAVFAMNRVNGSGSIPEFGTAIYRATWTPAADCEGNVTMSIRIINPDMDPSNDSMCSEVTVGKGNGAVVTDLKTEEDESGISLSWTDPTVETGKEGFESMAPFCYGDRIGDFSFYCRDNSETMYFGDFRFPHDSDKKAWQVISEKEVTEIMEEAGFQNTCLNAASGDRFLAAFTPLTFYIGDYLEADRWIVSPELKPESKFSFMMTSGMTGKIEKVQILALNDISDINNSEVIDEHQLLTAEWRKYEYTLPEGAKYFAIRYYGNTSESFFVLVDDIEYVPLAESPVLEGFDIYRDGSLIAEAVKTHGFWKDDYRTEGKLTYYNIKPVVRRNGVLTRGMMSNTSYVGRSGVEEIEEEADSQAEYYTLQGFHVSLPEKGIYIKRKAGKAYKVLVK